MAARVITIGVYDFDLASFLERCASPRSGS